MRMADLLCHAGGWRLANLFLSGDIERGRYDRDSVLVMSQLFTGPLNTSWAFAYREINRSLTIWSECSHSR